MKNKQYRILVSVLLVLSIGTGHIYTQSSQKSSYEKLQSKLEVVKHNMSEAKVLRSQNNQKIVAIQQQLSTLDSETNIMLVKIKELEASSALTGARVQDSKSKIAAREALFNKRIRAMNKMNPASMAAFLLGSENILDAYKRMDMLAYICESDQVLLKEMKAERDRIQSEKDVYDQKKYEMLKLTTQLTQLDENTNNQLLRLYREQINLKNDLEALSEQEDILLAESDRLEETLQGYTSDQVFKGGKLMWPTPGNYSISSPFGLRVHPVLETVKKHTGVDIPAPFGAPVVAAESGRVIISDWYGSYGRAVMIDHGDGVMTLYAHNDRILVKAGQLVERGSSIAEVGSTGMSTGPHLHFEVRKNGKPTDPRGWL